MKRMKSCTICGAVSDGIAAGASACKTGPALPKLPGGTGFRKKLTGIALTLLFGSLGPKALAVEYSIEWVAGGLGNLNWSMTYVNIASRNDDDVFRFNQPAAFRVMADDGRTGTIDAYLRFHACVESISFYSSPVAPSGHGAWTPDSSMSGRFGDDTAQCVIFGWSLQAYAPEACGPGDQYFHVADDFFFEGTLGLTLGHTYYFDYGGWLSARPAHGGDGEPIPGSGAIASQFLETHLRLLVPDAGAVTAVLLAGSFSFLALLRNRLHHSPFGR